MNQRWWSDRPRVTTDENSFLVVEGKLHDPSQWKLEALEQASVAVSNATRLILARISESLSIAFEEEYFSSAILTFSVNAERAERILALLAQKKVDDKGVARAFSNAYRFTSCIDTDDPERFMVTAEIASGTQSIKMLKSGKTTTTLRVSMISATTGFQQLLAGYFAPSLLEGVPQALRAGVCQEVAQQVMSYIGQITSTRVKGVTEFPTVEDRDPARRKQSYVNAIEALAHDIRPLTHAKSRDVYPGGYASDDPRGDKMIVHDERWFAVTRSPNPHPIPLLFTDGDKIRILEGCASFGAGVSKVNRHRGNSHHSEHVFRDRPKAVQQKGHTKLHSWYVAIPIPSERPESTHGRRLDLGLRSMPIQGGKLYRPREHDVLIPLSGNRDRFEKILRRNDLEIAWSRIVKRGSEWFLQSTLRVKQEVDRTERRVLGVAFGIDAVATWCLVDETGAVVERGSLSPNEQILNFLREKKEVEWDQAKGRWVGGKTFARQLEFIAHGVANNLVALAQTHRARLATEDVSYVQKASKDHEANVLFTAWNYGQLRRMLGYKAPLGGLSETLFTSDYVTNLTCPACKAIRGKNEKPECAKTWRENGVLHCRACGFQGVVTPEMRAERVAMHALEILNNRRASSMSA